MQNMAEKHDLDTVGDIGEFGGDQKRIKLEEQAQQLVKIQGPGDPHNAPPSRVVHARAVPDGCTHQQMIAVLQKFGNMT